MGSVRRTTAIALLAMFGLLISVVSSEADRRHRHHGHRHHHHHRHHFHAGFAWGHPFWYYPRTYYVYGPPVVVYEPVVVPQPVYVQPQVTTSIQPPAQGYWHYCMSAKAYYPTVQTCAEEWVKVPPRTE